MADITIVPWTGNACFIELKMRVDAIKILQI